MTRLTTEQLLEGYSRMTKAELETRLSGQTALSEDEYMELAAGYEELGVYLPEGEANLTEDDMRRDYEEQTMCIEAQMPEVEAEESLADYEEVRSAYKDYYDVQGDYLESDRAEEGLKAKADKAYRRYLEALSEYRRGEMAEREEAVRQIRDICENTYWPLERLSAKGID